MALYEGEQTGSPVDDTEALRQQFEMTKEQHGHVRATLRRRLKDAINQMERECKAMGQDIDRINALFPDRPETPSMVDYGAEAPRDARYR
jgi:hypothetical protein